LLKNCRVEVKIRLKLKLFLDDFDTLFFDLDGVIWEGKSLIPYAKEVLSLLRENKKKLFFISNNSTKTIRGFIKKFEDFSIPVFSEEIILSSHATLKYLEKQKDVSSVYVVGEEGLVNTLSTGGYNVHHDFLDNELISDIDAVVVGMDRSFNYEVLTIAIRTILAGAKFIGTNPDPTFPSENGISPGAGSMIGAISKALNKDPEIICGKPNPFMGDLLLNDPNIGLTKSRVLMIGDRVSTDLEFAENIGIKGLLVKTGFGEIEYKKYPDFPYFKVISSIADLMEK
jgi:4-nitrophenyl phosphatase